MENQEYENKLVISKQHITVFCETFKEFEKEQKEDQQHIVFGLTEIVNWYNGHAQLGHFLTYVVKNKFIEATCAADSVNYRCLVIYAKFLYNMIPQNYIFKAMEL
jgi:hypothetical protein